MTDAVIRGVSSSSLPTWSIIQVIFPDADSWTPVSSISTAFERCAAEPSMRVSEWVDAREKCADRGGRGGGIAFRRAVDPVAHSRR